MGKGSNVAKANAAREKNLKDKGKSAEERAEAKKKADADKQGIKCDVCMQTFMINATNGVLYQHVLAKHDKLDKEPGKCFARLKDFDPNKPVQVTAGKPQKKAPKKKDDVSALLAAGLNIKKK